MEPEIFNYMPGDKTYLERAIEKISKKKMFLLIVKGLAMWIFVKSY